MSRYDPLAAELRAQRERERRQRQQERDLDRHQKAEAKAAIQTHHESQEQQAARRTDELNARMDILARVLGAAPRWHGAKVDLSRGSEALFDRLFEAQKKGHQPAKFVATAIVGPEPVLPPVEHLRPIPEPGLFARLFLKGGEKHSLAVAVATRDAEAQRTKAVEEFQITHAAWASRVEKARAAHAESDAREAAAVEAHNEGVLRAEWAVRERDPHAVGDFVTSLLEGFEYPDDIDLAPRATYAADSNAVVIEIVLPTVEVIPSSREVSYVRAKNELKEKPRPRAEIVAAYRSLVAALTLRALRDLFTSTPPAVLGVVTVNGMLETIDPATGEDIRPCVVSSRVTREAFSALNLERIDPVQCLTALGASVSKKPEELAPVRPVIEFDMADRRFVSSTDVIDSLDGRPNIMDLTPFEFEQLTTNLFSKMGLDAKQTRSSRDGGVDCVAFDPRPVLGGKVVIQAKRYRYTVGVSAVRDLYGTMMNEGANKGVLVTTAGYGPDAFEFAKDKPIELIDGGNLLYLLAQHGVEARIVMPTD